MLEVSKVGVMQRVISREVADLKIRETLKAGTGIWSRHRPSWSFECLLSARDRHHLSSTLLLSIPRSVRQDTGWSDRLLVTATTRTLPSHP